MVAGGAGKITTGLLTPRGGGKSFGVFGQGNDIAADTFTGQLAVSSAEKGFVSNSTEMTDLGAAPKYLLISVFPKSHAWAG